MNHSDNKKRDTTAGYIHVSLERILKASQMVADYIGQIIIDAETAKNETTKPEQN